MLIWSIIGIILLVAADQLTKFLVVAYIKPNHTVTVIDGLLNFVYVENRGAAFGLMQNMRWFFIVLTLIACAGLLYVLFFYKEHNFWSRMACVLIIAGGIGNLVDRIKLSYVIDFISVSFFPPVFNFADCCVVVGVAFAVIYLLFSGRTEKEKEDGADHTNTDSGE